MSNSQTPITTADLTKFEAKIDTKFNGIDKKFDGIDRKFEEFGEIILGAIDQLRDDLFSNIQTIQSDIEGIKKQLKFLAENTEQDSNAYSAIIISLKNEVKTINKRIAKLEKHSV